MWNFTPNVMRKASNYNYQKHKKGGVWKNEDKKNMTID